MPETTQPSPKVFISYSWTSEKHTEWVADLGERLMNDGVVVVLDQWDLKDGQDLNDFMEQMVKDPEIKRVIIVSDSIYATKADDRKGGVGTETQIISQEVYESVDQTKFVPLLRERDGVGKACLPVYLKSRKYIDFSDTDNDADAYDQLLRNIYDRPRRRKPTLGKPPSHIFEDEATVVTSAQKAKRFREFVTSGKGNPSAAFDYFAEEFFLNLEELRLVYSREQEETWCQTIFGNIEHARAHRDVAVDVLSTGIKHIRDEWFYDALTRFLERLLPYQNRPQEMMGSFFECSEDNYKFLIYELFLYTVAAFVSTRRYGDARRLLDQAYVTPETLSGQRLKTYSFGQFNNQAGSLEGNCAKRENHRRLSVMADLVHDRADRTDIRFSNLVQADVICCLASSRKGDMYGWYPRTIIYAGEMGNLELFARAVTESGFEPLKLLLGFATPIEMINYICSDRMQRLWQNRELFRSVFLEEVFNLDKLRRVWDSTT